MCTRHLANGRYFFVVGVVQSAAILSAFHVLGCLLQLPQVGEDKFDCNTMATCHVLRCLLQSPQVGEDKFDNH